MPEPSAPMHVRRRPLVSCLTASIAVLPIVVACGSDPEPSGTPVASEDAGTTDVAAPDGGATDAGGGAGGSFVALGRVIDTTTLALSTDRTKVYGWGANASSPYHSSRTDFDHPVLMDIPGVPAEPIRAVMSTGRKTCILTETARALCFGGTVAEDSLGVGDAEERTSATPLAAGDVPANVKIVAMDIFAFGGCLVGDDGEAYCWGDFHRVPGAPGIETVTAPRRILRSKVGAEKIVDVATSINTSCVLSGGRAYCWFTQEPEPVAAGDLGNGTELLQVRTNDDLVCGAASDGDIYCWGSGFGRRFGTGSADSKSDAPYTRVSRAKVPAGVRFVDVAVGGIAGASCGLGSDGWAYCWGNGAKGAAGDDDTSEHEVLVPTPVARGDVPAGVTFVRVACGRYHCAAEGSDHEIYSWGGNETGALGASLPESTAVGHPVRVTPPAAQ